MESGLSGTNGGRNAQVSATFPRRRFTTEYRPKMVRQADVLDDVERTKFARLAQKVGSRR